MPNTRKSAKKPRTGSSANRRLEEARAEYITDATVAPIATSRVSGKNQITLPVAIMRSMGIVPGDELDMMAYGDRLVIRKRLSGEEHIQRLRGSIDIPEWRTPEGVEEYIRRERDSWED